MYDDEHQHRHQHLRLLAHHGGAAGCGYRALSGELHLERDLRRALEREEFRIVYQPVVSLTTWAPVAFEALVRWQHPEYGHILPGTFTPLLEEMGLITQLDEWVIREATEVLAYLQSHLAMQPAG